MTTPDATPSISMGSETRNAPATRPGPALRGTVPNAGYNDDNRQGVVTGQVYYVDVR